jgi:acyl-homoserine lactone acylase PvdQ
MTTISDEELDFHGFHHPENDDSHYSFNEELFHMRQKTKNKLNAKADFPDQGYAHPDIFSGWETIGSNCWAVHGNITKSGKPML